MNRKIGVVLSYAMMIFEVLSTLLLTPFIIKSLGQAEYGVYKLSASITAYLLLLDLGVGTAITRYIAKYKVTGEQEKARTFFGVVTCYYVAIAFISLFIGIFLIVLFPVVFAKGLSADEILIGQKLLSVTIINAYVTLATTAYSNIIIAYENFFVSKGVPIIQIIIRIIFSFIVLKLGWGSLGVVIVNLIVTILSRAYFVLYVFIKIKLIPKFKGISFDFVKEIISYSSLILLQIIATQINSSIDQILLGSLVSSSATILAIYSVGAQITQYFQTIGSSFTGVLMPGLVKMIENKATPKMLTNEMIRIGRLVFMVLGIVWGVFLVCGRQFITLWAGPENAKAYIVAILLMTAYLFILTESVGSQILWAMNKHKEQAILKFIIVLINIGLTIFLIKWKPLLGATVGTFISLLLGDIVVMNLIFVKKIKIRLFDYYKGLLHKIIPCLVLSVLIGFVTKMLLPANEISFIVIVLVMCVTYALLMYFFGMTIYEKSLVTSVLQKFKRKKEHF